MKFSDFSYFLSKIEATTKRLEFTTLLSDFLKEVKDDEIKYSMYLIQGRLVPKYTSIEFNMSGKLVLRALGEITGNSAKILSKFGELGDAGLVAEEVLKDNKDTGISITDVYKHLEEIAFASGKGSQEKKLECYKALVKKLDGLSSRYVTRVIIGNLRLGMSNKTVLDSLSWFRSGDKSLRKNLDVAYGARADIGYLAQVVVQTPQNLDIKNILLDIKLEPGTPVASKLVERENSSANVWERMPNCFVQPKLDGLRGQIHYTKNQKSKIKNQKIEIQSPKIENGNLETNTQDSKPITHNCFVFSRNMENLTEQFPEILRDVAKLGVESIILDSEIIGFNLETGEYLNFQETMKRKRKFDITETAAKIPVKAMCFDILYLNGEDLTGKPIEYRLDLLKKILEKNKTDSLDMLETKQMETSEELNDYFIEKVSAGLEGIITKETGSSYEPGTRNFKWIKLKANTQSDLVDTIDVVVLGYYTGKGARAKFGVGTLLAGVYNPDTDKFYSIGKVGSGFTDENLGVIFNDLKAIKIDAKPENVEVGKNMYPDIWVEPKIVMEIDADEITRSPIHTAAKGIPAKVKNDDSEKGLSIRFPRMKIWKRDKDLPNTVQEIVRMYELRKNPKF